MTNTESPDFPALAAEVVAIAARQAEALPDDLFTGDEGAELRERHKAVYLRAAAWQAPPIHRERPYTLVCSVEGLDADRWGYVAGYILDAVQLPEEVTSRPEGPTEARIDEVGDGVYTLSW